MESTVPILNNLQAWYGCRANTQLKNGTFSRHPLSTLDVLKFRRRQCTSHAAIHFLQLDTTLHSNCCCSCTSIVQLYNLNSRSLKPSWRSCSVQVMTHFHACRSWQERDHTFPVNATAHLLNATALPLCHKLRVPLFQGSSLGYHLLRANTELS